MYYYYYYDYIPLLTRHRAWQDASCKYTCIKSSALIILTYYSSHFTLICYICYKMIEVYKNSNLGFS